MKIRAVALLAVAVATSNGVATGLQQTPTNTTPEQPRFRGGANLVRVDAYVTIEGAPLIDLTRQDFEVLEDGVPQNVESFQLIVPRPPAREATDLREPNTVAESREMAADPAARVFVLFMDIWHVQLEGSHRAQGPITRLLERVIGQDDLVGVMHPEMAARNITFARRMTALTGMLKQHWYWGERGQVVTSDLREQDIQHCYPDVGETVGIAHEMIRRRREQRTLDALDDLIVHLENVREERKFVFLLSEGWLLTGPDPSLARVLSDAGPPGPVAIGTDPSGRLRTDPRTDPRTGGGSSYSSCERERSMLSYADHRSDFERLIQRANRANISFYPIDPRGLVVFDEPINSTRALTVLGPKAAPSADSARLRARYDGLRTLAVNTDGDAILDTNNLDRGLQRVLQDVGAYYLLGYYSTNTKLDGRFRRLTVRVKRPNVNVRSRPGYLAPTEAEMASSRVNALMNGAPPGHTTIPPTIARAFDGLAVTRGNVPLRVQTAGAVGRIWLTAEVDPSIFKSAEWQNGGRGRVVFEHDRGAAAPAQVEVLLPPGQRTFVVTTPSDAGIAPGRYVARLELVPAGSSMPFQLTADVTVPQEDWLLAESGLVTRRGPSTGLSYVPTADARFRRTERLRVEVPRADGGGEVAARVVGRDGQALHVAVTLSERDDPASQHRFVVADVALAPLAQGEYALEVTLSAGERKATATYAFRIVP